MLYRKKPVVIEAMQLTWQNWNRICDFVGVGKFSDGKPEGCYIDKFGNPLPKGRTSEKMGLQIPTLEGVMLATEGDWIIKGVAGEFYPCKNDIFEQTYEPVGDSES